MKFLKYINEDNLSYIKKELKDNCQPFLKEISKHKGKQDREFLFSGRKNKSPDWFEGYVRSNRNPKDTPLEVHKLLDKLFHKKFGVKARSNALFCTNEYLATLQYGNPYYIFPIGKYKTIWSPDISDLYLYLKRLVGFNAINDWHELSKEEREANLKLIETSNMLNSYTDKSHVFAKNSEIMLCCKEYIAIDHYFVREYNGMWGILDEIL